MFQGTGSDVGKSLLTAGLCRLLTRRGIKALPFKPQNMSNNAAVTADGGEIGRAQALQARAAGVPPTVHMNPVLLKPQTDMGSQIIVQGTVFGQAKARDYYDLKPRLLPKVIESYEIIKSQADIVIVEGAGSPAEVNLRAGDIANMGFAEAADVPVVLVADIDRGGVLASLVGTYTLLPDDEKARLKGYVVNKFRGDKTLFTSAIDIIGDQTGMPCFGVLPWFSDARLLPAEDAVALDTGPSDQNGAGTTQDRVIRITVPRLPRISNFDDLDPLKNEPDVDLQLVKPGDPIPADTDLVLLPGSKTTIGDLEALRAAGWDIDIRAHIRRGGTVLGLCAGYQMLGRKLTDPEGTEGPVQEIEGLNLLDIETVLSGAKTLREVTARDHRTGVSLKGYEMHIGQTTGPGCDRPMLDIEGRADGAVSADRRVMGCYLHGIFADDSFRSAFLSLFREGRQQQTEYERQVETVLDRFADHLQTHLDIDKILDLA